MYGIIPDKSSSLQNGSPEAVSCSRVGLPRHDDPFELVEGEREQEPDQRDHEQPGIHLLDRKRAPSAPDQEAETTLGADHLGDGNQHQTDADTELEAGHDDRQRPRQRDGPERVPAARLEVPADIEIDAVHLAHAGRRIDDHRKNTPIATMKIFDPSPSPKISKANGRMALLGIG